MNLPRNMAGKSFLVVTVAVSLYFAILFFFGWDEILRQVRGFPVHLMVGMGILSLANYLLRFLRWEFYLRDLSCPLPRRQSLALYFSAYVMVITPGKIGEVFKAAIMRERHGIALSKGVPIVLAERVYDFLAVLLLAWLGVFFWPGPFSSLAAGLVTAAVFPAALLLFHHPRVRARLLDKLAKAPLLRSHALALDESVASLGTLLRLRQMALSTPLTVLAWLAECLGLWLACLGLGLTISVPEATFTYAAGTLVGSLSFLPGGLGGTEATIIFLLKGLALPMAAAATVALLVRLFTLWLAVLVGLVFFLAFRNDLMGPARTPKAPGEPGAL